MSTFHDSEGSQSVWFGYYLPDGFVAIVYVLRPMFGTREKINIPSMKAKSRLSLRQIEQYARSCILPWLLPVYLLIGSFAAHTVLYLLQYHSSVATTRTNDDLDGSNEDGARPFWTSHKHLSVDSWGATHTAVLVKAFDVRPDVESHPTLAETIPHLLTVRFLLICVERAPPEASLSL